MRAIVTQSSKRLSHWILLEPNNEPLCFVAVDQQEKPTCLFPNRLTARPASISGASQRNGSTRPADARA
jgi:hypothetical protein